MKIFKVILAIALFSSLCLANITPSNEYLLNNLGSVGQKTQLGSLVNGTRNLLVARYSYAVQGGTSTGNISLLTSLTNTHSYAQLPINAIITNAWVNVLTQPTTSDGSQVTVALNSLAAGDLKAAATLPGYTTGFRQGIPAGTTTTFIKLTAAKTITATVALGKLASGKFDVFIEWVLGN